MAVRIVGHQAFRFRRSEQAPIGGDEDQGLSRHAEMEANLKRRCQLYSIVGAERIFEEQIFRALDNSSGEPDDVIFDACVVIDAVTGKIGSIGSQVPLTKSSCDTGDNFRLRHLGNEDRILAYHGGDLFDPVTPRFDQIALDQRTAVAKIDGPGPSRRSSMMYPEAFG